MSSQASKRYTAAEYLALEHQAEYKSEYDTDNISSACASATMCVECVDHQ